MMDANVAAKIMYADDKDADIAEKAAEFAAQSGPEAAAARGYVDSVIEPASARKAADCMLLRCFITNVSIRSARNMEPSK